MLTSEPSQYKHMDGVNLKIQHVDGEFRQQLRDTCYYRSIGLHKQFLTIILASITYIMLAIPVPFDIHFVFQ